MKFFAIFALAAFIAVAAALPYEYDTDYEYEAEESAPAPIQAPMQSEIARPERSYGKAKCGKAVLVACAPIVKKVKCKGKY